MCRPQFKNQRFLRLRHSECACYFLRVGLRRLSKCFRRQYRYTRTASTKNQLGFYLTPSQLEVELGHSYHHHNIDIRDTAQVSSIFGEYSSDIALVIHTAAQPSHDWAARDPQMDFTVNANGTLNLLEATRQFAATAPFIFTSTNKVYGATPNQLLHAGSDQNLRRDLWENTRPHLRRAKSNGRSYLVDQRFEPIFGALSELDTEI